MSNIITLVTGTTHHVSDADRSGIEQSMMNIGPRALAVDLDGERVFLSIDHVVKVAASTPDDAAEAVPERERAGGYWGKSDAA